MNHRSPLRVRNGRWKGLSGGKSVDADMGDGVGFAVDDPLQPVDGHDGVLADKAAPASLIDLEEANRPLGGMGKSFLGQRSLLA